MEDDNDSLGASVLFEEPSQDLDLTIQSYGQWLDESPMLLVLFWWLICSDMTFWWFIHWNSNQIQLNGWKEQQRDPFPC